MKNYTEHQNPKFENEPHIVVIREARWWRKPRLWLVCPRSGAPECFQVGEFDNWIDAELARVRLTKELNRRKITEEPPMVTPGIKSSKSSTRIQTIGGAIDMTIDTSR